jgi:predicted nucleic acid-binding protein
VSARARYLLDTNVVSEARKKLPDKEVMLFFDRAEASALFVSVLTLGELRKGVALKRGSDPDGARVLGSWVDGVEANYADRVLGVDSETARLWGELSADRRRPVVDTLLAATAMVHKLTFVTRNVGDVRDMGVRVLNPWKEL